MVIPCLCSFTVPSSPSAELVGARPLHLLTQTVLLLKHPTGVFVAVANAKPPINKKRTRTLSHREPGSSTNCLVERSGIRFAATQQGIRCCLQDYGLSDL